MALLGFVAMAGAREEETTSPLQRPSAWKGVGRIGRVPLLMISSLLATLVQYSSFTTTYGFIPVYAAKLGASSAQLGWMTAATQIPFTLATLTAGRLNERYGERMTVVTTSLIMAVTTFLTPFMSNLGLLALTRIGYGMGHGIIYPTLMGLSLRAVRQTERASAMGIFQAVYALGMFGGPALSGLIADYVGLSTMFAITGGVSVGMSALALWGLRNEEKSS